jgi:SAM-dependent methyltransferase
MSKQPEKDYVLGTNEAELARLGLQHQVWRSSVLAFWQRSGLTRGKTVIDAGAGPGFATFDLADIVGREGRVIAIERSGRYVEFLRSEAKRRDLPQIEVVEGDLLEIDWPKGQADFVWCRWVLAFVADPAKVIARMAPALKPGGAILLHEYCDYRAWSFLPSLAEHQRFVDLVIQGWRASGGEPDIARDLPRLLPAAGLSLERADAVQFAITPRDFMWHWPLSFVDVNTARQVELGNLSEAEAKAMREAIHARFAEPTAMMLTPSVLQVVARRRA